MSERENGERAAERGAPTEQPAGLFERVRALFGLTSASVRDDIEDALEGADGTPTSRRRSARS